MAPRSYGRFRRMVLGDASVRLPRTVIASVVVGLLVGLLVAAFDYVTVELLLEEVVHWPLAAKAAAPFVGLCLAAAILHVGGTNSSTSDEYVRAFHERTPDLPLRHLPATHLA